MNLTVSDRYAILAILPEASDYLGVKTVSRLKKVLPLTPEESKAVNLRSVPGTGLMMWDDAAYTKDIPLSSLALTMLQDAVKARAKELSCEPAVLELAEKFFSESESRVIIAGSLIEMHKAKRLTERHLELFERFCPDLCAEDEKCLTS